MSEPTDGLPPRLADIVADFHALPVPERLQLLVELGAELPEPGFRTQPELFEAVTECQAPVFVRVDLDDGADPAVRLHISAPPQAPATRGFAGLLHAALDGAPASEVLGLPPDVVSRLGLETAVSPLRLRGMAGLLERIRRQVARGHTPPADR